MEGGGDGEGGGGGRRAGGERGGGGWKRVWGGVMQKKIECHNDQRDQKLGGELWLVRRGNGIY